MFKIRKGFLFISEEINKYLLLKVPHLEIRSFNSEIKNIDNKLSALRKILSQEPLGKWTKQSILFELLKREKSILEKEKYLSRQVIRRLRYLRWSEVFGVLLGLSTASLGEIRSMVSTDLMIATVSFSSIFYIRNRYRFKAIVQTRNNFEQIRTRISRETVSLPDNEDRCKMLLMEIDAAIEKATATFILATRRNNSMIIYIYRLISFPLVQNLRVKHI